MTITTILAPAVRLATILLFAGMFALSASAQDEGDRLLAQDGDILVYRSEDGAIKIKREGSEDDTWLAVVNPDEDGNVMIIKKVVEKKMLDGKGNVMVFKSDGDAPEGEDHVMVWKSDDGKEIEVEADVVFFGDGEDHEVVDADGRMMIFKSDDGKTVHLNSSGPNRFRFKGDPGEEMENVFVFRDEMLPHLGPERMREHLWTAFDHSSEPLVWFGARGEEIRKTAELERKSRELARQIADADDADKGNLEAELDDLLVEIFDAKQQARSEEIQKLQERLQSLTESQQTRMQQRADIIARRKKELLGERDPLEW